MTTEDLDLRGEIIDSRYRIERRIGQGGMGVVWQAQHLGTRQPFAIKTVHGSRSPNRKVLRRLLHEARATAAIQSRNVVRVVDVKPEYVHRGRELPFIVMELLRGCTLSDYLENTPPMQTGELIWVTRQVSHALTLAHERGIVHRDLKPSNIFLAEDDDGNVTVKVCDFGIAKLQGAAITQLAEAGTLSTETGALFGTPRYMAPEQLRKAGHETPATDQWALGLIVFRALTGTTYFEAARNLAELILAIVHDAFPLPSQVSSAFPAALDAWFLHCCQRNPAERFESIRVQQQELEQALGSPSAVPIQATQLLHADTGSTPIRLARQVQETETPESRSSNPRASSTWRYWVLGVAAVCTVFTAKWLATRIAGSMTRQVVESASPTPAAPILSSSGSQVSAAAPPPPLASVAATAPTEAQPPSGKTLATRRVPHHVQPAAGASSSVPPRLLPRGAPCTRSAQCEEGLCAAEVCQ